jgi:hypothetical protein
MFSDRTAISTTRGTIAIDGTARKALLRPPRNDLPDTPTTVLPVRPFAPHKLLLTYRDAHPLSPSRMRRAPFMTSAVPSAPLPTRDTFLVSPLQPHSLHAALVITFNTGQKETVLPSCQAGNRSAIYSRLARQRNRSLLPVARQRKRLRLSRGCEVR